ncbi:MAG TPA: GGDEF domain-containing protein [Spirochaetota bacterium]|nr:GGDEF domain-containing protein [Spirochaetota bacterium]HPQ52620.1 GGDEF domain-containing protein [Spirochaetota bacterium]
MPEKVFQTIENIELDILSDIDDTEIFQFIIASLKHETDTPYSILTQAILHYPLHEAEAEIVWQEILKNKSNMESLLGRNISIKTALVDYFTRERIYEKITIFIKDNMINAFDTAMRDSLTGLYSHAVIHAELEKEFQSSRRYNVDLSVVFIDIDDFKRYNDSFGHIAGDRILRLVAATLKENLRTTDKIGRYGGEEFLIVLPHTNRENAFTIAHKLLQSIQTSTAGNSAIPQGVTVSIGISQLSESMQDGHDLIKNADINMYRAKKEGKNRICCSE